MNDWNKEQGDGERALRATPRDWAARAEQAEAEVLRLTTVLRAIAAAGICGQSHLIAADALKHSPKQASL